MNRHIANLTKSYISYQLGFPKPTHTVLRLTYRCNLKCSFCRIHRAPPVEELSEKSLRELIDALARLGVVFLNFTGGEPLLREDICRLAQRAQKNSMYTILTTNGTLVNKKNALELRKNFNVIRVSIDGPQKIHDSIRGRGMFVKAVRGASILSKEKQRLSKVMAHTVVSEKNIAFLPELVKYTAGIFDSHTFIPEHNLTNNYVFQKEFKQRISEINVYVKITQSGGMISQPSLSIGKKYCEAGRLFFSILPDGSVSCCPNRHFIIGNIRDESFLDIYRRGIPEETKKAIAACPGCFSRCTTELAMMMRKKPWEHIRDFGMIRRVLGFD